MALCNQFFRPITPSPSRLRVYDPLSIDLRKVAAAVKRVHRASSARPQLGHIADSRRDSEIRFSFMSWRNDFDNTESRRKKDEPGSVLRNTVIGTIHFVSRDVVAKEGECRKKVTEDPVSSQLTHIFYTDDIGFQLSQRGDRNGSTNSIFHFLRIQVPGCTSRTAGKARTRLTRAGYRQDKERQDPRYRDQLRSAS